MGIGHHLEVQSMKRAWVLVLLSFTLLALGSVVLGQDPVTGPGHPPNGWNGNTPQQTPAGFVSAHTFYWMIGVGSAIVASLTTVIGVLWSKLNKKEEDAKKDVLAQITLVAAASTQLAADWADEKKDLRKALAKKDERLEKQHEKTLKIAVRAQQAVEALANLPIGENVLDDDEEES